MITAVDSTILLDIFTRDATFGPESRAALRASVGEGALVACDIVWAETAAWFGQTGDGTAAIEALGVGFLPLTVAAAEAAGDAWRRYRSAGGGRERLVADFVIGAHALLQADRLLTRDRGFYRRYFSRLTILDPTTRSELDG